MTLKQIGTKISADFHIYSLMDTDFIAYYDQILNNRSDFKVWSIHLINSVIWFGKDIKYYKFRFLVRWRKTSMKLIWIIRRQIFLFPFIYMVWQCSWSIMETTWNIKLPLGARTEGQFYTICVPNFASLPDGICPSAKICYYAHFANCTIQTVILVLSAFSWRS